MHKCTTNRKNTITTQQIRSRLPVLLAGVAFVLVLLSLFVTLTLHSQTSQAQPVLSTGNGMQQHAYTTVATSVPTQKPTQVGSSRAPVKAINTPTVSATPTSIPTAPTLIASTPQQTQYGVFPLSSGGPIPVPEGVLHPTNIARVLLNSTLVSVYAGSMTPNPQQGILCVLHEDLTTGQMHISMYQSPKARGALTILAIRQNVLTITDSTKAIGTFDLNTNQFHW